MFYKFLEELRQKGIEVTFSEGKIRYSGPKDNITPDLISRLKEFKGDLIKYYWPNGCNDMVSIYPGGTKTPIILVYCNSIMYFLSDYFGPDQPIYGFYDKGWLNGRKNVHKSVGAIADDYIAQLKKVLPGGPYLLGGHSIGGNIAYEMAVKLQNGGNDVPLLFLLDSRTPFSTRSFDLHHDKYCVYGHMIRPFLKKMWQFIKMPFFNFLFLLVNSFPDCLRRTYIVTNYLLLIYKWRPEKFKGDLLLFKAEMNERYNKEDYGWQEFVNKVTSVNLVCDHLTIVRGNNHIDIMGEEISKRLINKEELKLISL